jgi:hypothetical protein
VSLYFFPQKTKSCQNTKSTDHDVLYLFNSIISSTEQKWLLVIDDAENTSPINKLIVNLASSEQAHYIINSQNASGWGHFKQLEPSQAIYFAKYPGTKLCCRKTKSKICW